MNVCRHCKAQNDLYLCDACTTQLANMLNQIAWLIDELDARIQKLDRINLGTIGRNRRPDQLNVMDFDAAETARKTRKTLLHWVETIATRHTGRTPPALATVQTKQLARWLEAHVDDIARLDLTRKGRHQLYDDIARLAGQSTDTQGGQLVRAINPIEKHLVGPCPTITGRHRNGTPRQCGNTLFADTYDHTVTCPTCKHDIDVKDNRERAAAARDLQTRTDLIDILANIDEPITEAQLDAWIAAKRLRPRGYRHEATIIEFRINEHDEPVYSVDRAQKLRRRDQNLRQRRRITHA